jgi:hypothetical protein
LGWFGALNHPAIWGAEVVVGVALSALLLVKRSASSGAG